MTLREPREHSQLTERRVPVPLHGRNACFSFFSIRGMHSLGSDTELKLTSAHSELYGKFELRYCHELELGLLYQIMAVSWAWSELLELYTTQHIEHFIAATQQRVRYGHWLAPPPCYLRFLNDLMTIFGIKDKLYSWLYFRCCCYKSI